ncbi:hypothetical protein V8D89_005290 [Ganoderma adspersum]
MSSKVDFPRWTRCLPWSCNAREGKLITRSPLHSFDVHLFASTLPVLGLVNLQHLSLTGFDNTWRHSFYLSQPPAHGQGTSSLASLQQLTCNNCIGLSFILPALLSLLTVRALVIRAWVHHPSPVWAAIHTCHSIPLASLAIQDLVLVDQGARREGMERYYQFFESVLAPGSLRAFGTGGLVASDFGPHFSRFIGCEALRGLLSISVEASLLTDAHWEDGAMREYPDGEGAFERLGAAVANCTRLRCFRIWVGYTGDPHSKAWRNQACSRRTFKPIIANLPRTLCTFAICIEIYAWRRAWKDFCDKAVGLNAVDRVLSGSVSPPRFPHLERVELDVLEDARMCWLMKPVEGRPKPMPLPRLKAAGLLQLRVVHEVDMWERRNASVPGIIDQPLAPVCV